MATQCPQCSTRYVRRAHREGVLERLASLVYVYPFRCQLCTHRFRVLQWGIRYANQLVDRRQFERIPARVLVTFSGDRISGEGVVTNLSVRNCALQTATPLSEGALLQMRLQIWDRKPAVTIERAAVRSIRPSSVGLQFIEFQGGESHRLGQFVSGLLGLPAFKSIPG